MRTRNWIGIISYILTLSVCLYGFASSYLAITEVYEAESWPTTQGVIITSEKQACGKNGYKYPSVRYEYTVNETIFSGSRITLSPTCSNAGRDLVPQEKVTIHYSQNDPSTSVLYLDGQHFWDWFFLVGSAILIVLGLVELKVIPIYSAYEKREMARLRNANAHMETEIRERQKQ